MPSVDSAHQSTGRISRRGWPVDQSADWFLHASRQAACRIQWQLFFSCIVLKPRPTAGCIASEDQPDRKPSGEILDEPLRTNAMIGQSTLSQSARSLGRLRFSIDKIRPVVVLPDAASSARQSWPGVGWPTLRSSNVGPFRFGPMTGSPAEGKFADGLTLSGRQSGFETPLGGRVAGKRVLTASP